jgi:hypothetical protein
MGNWPRAFHDEIDLLRNLSAQFSLAPRNPSKAGLDRPD